MPRIAIPEAHQLPVYAQLAVLLQAIKNCKRSGNTEWEVRHSQRIADILSDYMPSGSGWDNGTTLDIAASTPNKLVFTGDYHHVNEGGMYDGWTEHTITVRPSLAYKLDLTISGRDRNYIKDYLHDLFWEALMQKVTHYNV